MKKFLSFLLAALTLLAFLTACGGGAFPRQGGRKQRPRQ